MRWTERARGPFGTTRDDTAVPSEIMTRYKAETGEAFDEMTYAYTTVCVHCCTRGRRGTRPQ